MTIALGQHDRVFDSVWRTPDTAVLLLTFIRNEKFIASVRENLDMFWPKRPRTIYVSDGALLGDDVVLGESKGFAPLLKEVLIKIRAKLPELRFVYLLLEDLAPLWSVDDKTLGKVEDHMKEKGAKYFYLPWQRAEQIHHEPASAEMSAFEGCDIKQVKADCPYYNSLVMSWWDVDYLEDTVNQKLAAGMDDPWRFEHPLESEQPTHFYVGAGWPTIWSGFMLQGKLNRLMLTDKSVPPSPVKRDIYRRFFGPLSPICVPLYRQYVRLKRYRAAQSDRRQPE